MKSATMQSEGEFLLEPEAAALLTGFGIPYVAHGFALDLEESLSVASHIGYPVVLKVVSLDIVHKSDVGGVVTDLQDADELRSGMNVLQEALLERAPRARIEGFLVGRHAPPGRDVIVGGVEDQTFGMTVMLGVGGVLAELLSDVSIRVLPIDAQDARAMITEIKAYPWLAGTRGQVGVDLQALEQLLVTVSGFLTAHPEIAELDLNPVRVHERGISVLDARIICRKPRE